MNQLVSLVLAGLAGMGLSLFYFGGLWITIRSLPASRWPGPLLLGSFVGRTALVVVGFYFVMGGRVERILACLAAFVMTRALLLSWLKSERAPAAFSPKSSKIFPSNEEV